MTAAGQHGCTLLHRGAQVSAPSEEGTCCAGDYPYAQPEVQEEENKQIGQPLFKLQVRGPEAQLAS